MLRWSYLPESLNLLDSDQHSTTEKYSFQNPEMNEYNKQKFEYSGED